MEHKTADYYDLPTDLLPAANFADRPSSEISDISFMEGLWTFMVSSSSDSDSDSNYQSTPTNHQNTSSTKFGVGFPLPWTTHTTVSSDEDRPEACRKGLDDGISTVERPRLRQKVATAPPGALSLQNFKPQPPRREISARRRLSRTDKGRQPHVAESDIPTNSGGRSGCIEEQTQSTRTIPPFTRSEEQRLAEKRGSQWRTLSSFSKKARVQKTLNEKNMKSLTTDTIDSRSTGLVRSPLSILITPSELYGISEEQKQAVIEGDTTAESEDIKRPESLLSQTPLPITQADSEVHDVPEYNGVEAKLRVYLPGRIPLQSHPAKFRRDSVATLDSFNENIAAIGRRAGDIATADSIVSFFEDLGVTEQATYMGHDKYWLRESEEPRRHTRPRRTSVPNSEEAVLGNTQKVTEARSPRSSRFSFSSDSSSASKSLHWGPIRQRIRLKKLLSPG